jgi:hypothetical protein
LDAIAGVAVAFYALHTHNNAYAVVAVDADGNESWTTPTGEAMYSPAQLEEAARSRLAMMDALKNQTEIGVTRLGE